MGFFKKVRKFARPALSALGGIGGSFFGGPLGGAIGSSLGGLFGGIGESSPTGINPDGQKFLDGILGVGNNPYSGSGIGSLLQQGQGLVDSFGRPKKPNLIAEGAEQGRATREYLKNAFPELNAWERAGSGGSNAGIGTAGQINARQLKQQEFRQQERLLDKTIQGQKDVATIQTQASTKNTETTAQASRYSTDNQRQTARENIAIAQAKLAHEIQILKNQGKTGSPQFKITEKLYSMSSENVFATTVAMSLPFELTPEGIKNATPEERDQAIKTLSSYRGKYASEVESAINWFNRRGSDTEPASDEEFETFFSLGDLFKLSKKK